MTAITYPGLEALKKQYRAFRTNTQGAVYGYGVCSRCGGGGTVGVAYSWGGTCFRCSGNGIDPHGVRIDEKGWVAREKARLKREANKEKVQAEKAAIREANRIENESRLGFNIDAGIKRYQTNPFISDILSKARTYVLSDKQIAAVKKVIDSEEAKLAVVSKLADVKISSERQTIKGRVVSVKVCSTVYGMNYKMLVEREDGYKFYGTMPSGINPKKGDLVSFDAAPKVKEAGFAYYSRPTKAVILEVARNAEETAQDKMQIVALDNAYHRCSILTPAKDTITVRERAAERERFAAGIDTESPIPFI